MVSVDSIFIEKFLLVFCEFLWIFVGLWGFVGVCGICLVFTQC